LGPWGRPGQSSPESGETSSGTGRGSGGVGSRAHQGLISVVGWVGVVASEGARQRQVAATAGSSAPARSWLSLGNKQAREL
jgi:hypothetical protein